MTTSHIPNCEHPGCHEVGTEIRSWRATYGGYEHRYLCAAHADEKEKADG